MPYDWAELYEAFYPVVAERAHESLLNNDKGYYNWAFEQAMGMSYEEWFKSYADERVSEIEKKIIELRDAVAEETAQIAEGKGREVALSSGTLVPASLLGWVSKEGAKVEASKQFNDVLESINTFRNNDFVSGFDEGFDWADALTLGLADLGTSYTQLQLLEKAKRGEQLSNSESKVLELLQLTQEFEGIKESLGWERTLSSSVGSGLGSTVAMAPGFALGMAGASRIGTTTKLLSNVAKNASKKAAVKQVGKNIIHNLGTSYARGAAVGWVMPSTYTSGLKELQEQYTFNPDGTIKFEPKSKALAFMGGYIDTMNEYASEAFGSTLGEILGYGARAFGRVTRLNKAVDAVMDPINKGIGKAIDKGLSYLPIEDEAKLAGVRKALRGMFVPNAELDEETKELMRMFGVQDGKIAEAGGEVFGDFMSQVMRDIVGAKTDYSDFKDGTYWETQLLVATLYGGSMNVLASIKEGVSDYQQIVDLGKYNKKLIDKIESRELRNKVIAAIADGSIEEMAAKMADIEWQKYHATDKAKVLDYVRNEMMLQTLAGKVEEGGRVDAFVKEAAKLAGVTYQGKGGLIMETTVGGRQYYIIDGKPADRSDSSMLTCIDKETGERKAILSKSLPEQPVTRTYNEVLQEVYTSRFSVDAEATRISSLQSAYDQMERPTAEIARDMMKQMGITPPAEGDVITLADGRSAKVTQDLEDGFYVVRLEGKLPLLFTVPFYSIQSANALTAEAQMKMAEGKVMNATEKASEIGSKMAEEGVINEETIAQTPEASQEGTAEEATPTEQSAEQAEAVEQIEEQVANNTLDMSNVPTDAEGDVDYDAIDDPVQYARVYAHEAGSKAEAAKEVEDLKRRTLYEADKLEEKAKNEITASAKRKKLKEAKKLRERAAFYDKVLPQFEEMEEEYTSVVKNEYSQQVAEPTLRVLDAIAKKLGLKVRFVDEVRTASGNKANASINGNEVEIAFMERIKSIAFLMGHEFTHRMQGLSPEQYAEFKQMVKDFVGEEVWNTLVAQTAQAYAKQNQPFTITLIEDEVTADAAGELVESNDAFLKYLEGKKEDKTFLMKVAEFLREMVTMFNTANDRERERQYLGLLDGVNKLIESAASAEATSNGQGERFSIIGEQGASALDMAEEATIRMDNLAIARQMEERGDSALDIRMATSWERGADGLWRYELMDAEVNLYDGNEATIRKKIKVAEEEEKAFMQQSKADTKELRERTNSYLAEMRDKYGVAEGEETDVMTEEEIAHLQSLTGKEIAFEDYKEHRRNDLYNRRMALEAQLAYVMVKNSNAPAEIATTRLGHILKGEYAEQLFKAYPSLRDMEVQFVSEIRDGAFAAYVTENGYKRVELNAKKAPVDMLAPYLLHEVQHAIQDIEGFAGGGNLSSLQNDGEVTAKEAYDYYRKIAGEVEARNVSARLNMSAEERMNTLLSETEDVAREDQIFLRNGVEMAMAEEQGVRYSLIVVNGLKNALNDFDASGDIGAFVEAVSKVNKEYGYHEYLTNIVMDYEEDGDADWFVSRIRNIVGETNEDYAYTAGGVRYSIVTDQIEHLFNEAVAGNLTGKPIAIGELTKEGKDYLEMLSGLKFKDKVSFTLNPSDLVHIHNDHFEGNEKDKGNNIPLTTLDIKRIVDVISFPTAIMYGKEKNSGRNLFYFLMDTGAGTYNLLEVYSDRKGNLSTKTYYKTKKDAAQRVMELKSSLLPTSETYSGAILSDTKIPQIFELPKVSTRISLITPEMDAAYLSAVERGDMATAQQMVMEAAKLAMPNTKVVDENGNPKVVYHQTNATVYINRETGQNWDELDWRERMEWDERDDWDEYWEEREFNTFSRVNARTTNELDGFFFAPEYDEYHEYGNRTIEAFLNIENPASNGDYNIDSSKTNAGRDERIRMQNEGYDGVINKEDGEIYEYIAFNPNQIKSAEPVTYDDNGNVIPLSERFNPKKEDIRYSLAAYNGDIERILSDSKAIAKTYAISSDVIVAKSTQDYIAALLAYGVPENKIYSDTEAVYLDWEDVIVVNAQGIKTPIRLTEVLTHENMHSLSHQDKESITKVAGKLPILKVVEYAGKELGYSLDYIKKHFADIPLEVVDEILSTFVESISTMPVVGGGYVLRRYLMGYLTIEDAMEASKQIIKAKYGSKYSELTAATMPLLQDNLIKLRDERYKEGKVGNTTVWSEGPVTNGGGFAETGRSEEESRAESQTAQRDGRTEAESAGGEGGEVGKFSINTDITEEDAYKASLLEEAMRMEREATSNGMDIAQEIADATGWVRLANGEWKYYGEGKLDITDKASAERAAFRWLESKKAVKIAQVRKIYEPLIKAAKASVVEVGRSKKTDYAKLKRYADKVEYILQGAPVESLPIEDQILVDIALGQRLKWNDGEGKRGLKSELGLRSAKNERMGAVTLGARDYIEDYIGRLMERNNGYERSLDDNDIRNAIIAVFAAYPSPKAALDELYSRYKPTAEVDQAEEALARLEYERDAALAEIEAEYKEIFEDFDNNPDTYIREHQEAESYNANLDMYVDSLTKARKEVERLERQQAKRKLSDEEKMAAMRAVKSAVAKELRDGLGRYTRKYDIQRMMDAVSDARTPYTMLKAIDKAMESLFEVKWRREFARMQMLTKSKLSYGVTAIDASSFLNTFVADHKITASDARKIMNDYWRGTKANGVSVAKYIDDNTRQVMEFINQMVEYADARARFEDIKTPEIIAFTRSLREKLEDYTSLKDNKLKIALANDAVRKAVIDAVDILELYWKAQELQLSLNDDAHKRHISALEIKAKEITAQLREVNQQLKDLADGKVVVTPSGVKDRDLLRKELQERYNSLLAEREEAYAEMYNVMPDIINLMQEANRAVETLLRTGKVNLAAERTKRKEHEKELINDVLADLASPASPHKHYIDIREKNLFERIATGIGSTIGAPLGSMDYMLRAIGRNAPLGEGRTYNRFAYAFQTAYDNIYTNIEARKKALDDECKRLWGENYNKVHKMAESTKVMTLTYTSAKNGKDGEWQAVEQTTDIYVTQAMYILATWNQAEGRNTLEKQGFTEESIEDMRRALESIDPRWIEFADWVVNEYLPSGRERYNAVHREIFGISMSVVPNYFPIKRAKEKLQKEEDVAAGDADLLPSTVVGAIKERTSNVVPIDLETSFFEALNENTSVMEAWAEMAGLIQDINTILSNGAVQKTMLDINATLFSDFKKAAQVATLSYIGKTPDIDKKLGTILNRLWAGSKIAFRLNTAFKQLSSALLFAGYSTDPKFQAILLWRYLGGVGKMPVALMNGIVDGTSYLTGHSFANIDIMTNIEWARENMPSFAKRWNEGVAGNELMARTTSGNTSWKQRTWYVKFDDAVREVTKFGMKPNAFIDAFTSAAGARAVYDYEFAELQKNGYSKEEAHTLAIIKAEMAFNTTQQSNEGLYLSPMQMDRSIVATTLSTFMNAPYAMFRNTMIGAKEILRNPVKQLKEIERMEFKRAMGIAKKHIDAQVANEVAQGIYTKEEAEQRKKDLIAGEEEYVMPHVESVAKKKRRQAKAKAAVMVFLNGYAGQVAFNLMGKLWKFMFGDDDEEKKKMLYDITIKSAWEAPVSMMPLGGYVTSAINGYSASVLPATDELFKEISTIAKGLREEDISPEVIYAATTMCMRWGLGLSVDTIVNIALGLENMIEEGVSPEAILKVINAPEKQIRSIVGQRREGETTKEYTERVMRFYSIADTPIYEDYYYTHGEKAGKRKNEETPRGMSNKEMNRIKYEDAHRRDVVLTFANGKELADIEETRKAYRKSISEGYGKLSEAKKEYLRDLKKKISDRELNLMRLMDDTTYYKVLTSETALQKEYIEKYEQFKQ